jgi:hypothetical protein
VKENILFQDNKSTMLLENNGKRSLGKRTRALNICHFFLMDQIEKGNVSMEYCPTKEMIGDHMSQPLQEKLFSKFKDQIMGSKLVLSPKMVDDRNVLNVIHIKGKDTINQHMVKISLKYTIMSLSLCW